MHHGSREAIGILATREVEPVDVPRVPPLMEGGGGLVVLQAAHYAAVDHHLGGETLGYQPLSKESAYFSLLNLVRQLFFIQI